MMWVLVECSKYITDSTEVIYGHWGIYSCDQCGRKIPDTSYYEIFETYLCEKCILKVIQMVYRRRMCGFSSKAILLKQILKDMPDIYINIVRYFRPLTIKMEEE